MKRIALGIIFIICLVMCLGFVGCGENNDPIETTTAEKEINTVPTTIAYEVFTEEDMTYIKFIGYEEKSSINVGMPFPLEFQTPYEMKDTLTNRKLTQEQIARLARYMGGNPKREDGSYEICNINHLQMPKVSGVESLALREPYSTSFAGAHYSVTFDFEKVSHVTLEVMTSLRYFQIKNAYYDIAYDPEVSKVVSETTLEDRNATEIIYYYGKLNRKLVHYPLNVNGVTMLVAEYYILAEDTLPLWTAIYGIKGDVYYIYFFMEPQEILSAEWLSLFDIQPIPDLVIE